MKLAERAPTLREQGRDRPLDARTPRNLTRPRGRAEEAGEGDPDDGEGEVIAAESPEGRGAGRDELGDEVEGRRRQEDPRDGRDEPELVGQGFAEVAAQENPEPHRPHA